MGNYLIDLFLPLALNRQTYRHLLEEELPTLLKEVPLRTRRSLWFMHDGGSAHFRLAVRQSLNNKWIGRACPVRFLNYNLPDYFVLGHLKSL